MNESYTTAMGSVVMPKSTTTMKNTKKSALYSLCWNDCDESKRGAYQRVEYSQLTQEENERNFERISKE